MPFVVRLLGFVVLGVAAAAAFVYFAVSSEAGRLTSSPLRDIPAHYPTIGSAAKLMEG